MARIKYSALVTGMSGKLNGSVMARNKGGAYVRNKTTPTNPQTGFQQRVRAVFGSIASAWRGHSQSNIISWNKGASNFPYTDYWGDQRFLSGFALHQKLNANLANALQPTIAVCPTPVEVGEVSGLVGELDPAGGILKIGVTTIGDIADCSFLIFATPNIPLGRNFVKNDFRRISSSAAADGPIDIKASYEDRFGSIADVGRVFVRVVVVNNYTGQNSVGYSVEIIAS